MKVDLGRCWLHDWTRARGGAGSHSRDRMHVRSEASVALRSSAVLDFLVAIVFFAGIPAGALYASRWSRGMYPPGRDVVSRWRHHHRRQPRDVEISTVILGDRPRRKLFAIRSTTPINNAHARLHRGTSWYDGRLPMRVDADDEPRACCSRHRTAVPHIIVSDGAHVVAWLDHATANVDDLDAIVDEVTAIIAERPMINAPATPVSGTRRWPVPVSRREPHRATASPHDISR